MTEERPATASAPPPTSAGGVAAADSQRRRVIARRTKILTAIVLILLALGAARTVDEPDVKHARVEAGTSERAKQYVKTAVPKSGEIGQTLALPGTLQGFVQSPINARASGYLKRGTRTSAAG